MNYNSAIMMKFLAACTILCVFIGCATTNTAEVPGSKATHLICVPERDSLIFIGVSGPQLKPEQEVEAAREDAARKVSLYHGLAASFVAVQGSGSNALDYYSGSDLQIEYDTTLDRYTDWLTFDPERDVIREDGVTYIRFSYPGIYPVDISYPNGKDADGQPEWIKRPPIDINGFMAQTGFARRQQRPRDTIIKASEDAIAGLISRTSSLMKSGVAIRNDVNSSVTTQQSSGSLLYFMILETWMDPENMSVWTLTIAKSMN